MVLASRATVATIFSPKRRRFPMRPSRRSAAGSRRGMQCTRHCTRKSGSLQILDFAASLMATGRSPFAAAGSIGARTTTEAPSTRWAAPADLGQGTRPPPTGKGMANDHLA